MSPGVTSARESCLRMNKERLASRNAAADVPRMVDEAHHFEHAAGPGQLLFQEIDLFFHGIPFSFVSRSYVIQGLGSG